MVAWAATGTTAEEHGIEMGVRLFATETWPGEPLTKEDLQALMVLAGLGRDVSPRTCERLDAISRRIEGALAVARATRCRELRSWALRGWLQPAEAVHPAQTTAWSLALAPLLPEAFELWVEQRLNHIAKALAELWTAEETAVLVLRHPPPWTQQRRGAPVLDQLCKRIADALKQRRTERGWCGPVEVLVAAG